MNQPAPNNHYKLTVEHRITSIEVKLKWVLRISVVTFLWIVMRDGPEFVSYVAKAFN